MKKTVLFFSLTGLMLSSFTMQGRSSKTHHQSASIKNDTLVFKSGYLEVNGINMYYEVYGQGEPLILIHGGGSTISTTFERVIPLFARKYRVIAMDLQAHGRTGDRAAPETFEQDADDVTTLLRKLNIDRADFFGFSNGATTTLQIAIRHPEIINKIVLGSPLAKRDGVPSQFWSFMKAAKLENMPEPLKAAYLKDTPDPQGLQVMHDKDASRMVNFRDIPDEQIRSITAPAFIIVGDQDIIKPEHAIEIHKLISHSRLAIIPGMHGEYIEEITTLGAGSKEAELVVPMIEHFLDSAATTIRQR